jgi:hypothetical protein
MDDTGAFAEQNKTKKESRREFIQLISSLAVAGTGALFLDKFNNKPLEMHELMFPNDSTINAGTLAEKLDSADVSKFSGEFFNPQTHRIVSDDTISKIYSPPNMTNQARLRYGEIVAGNAEKLIPASKPFLETILRANHNYRTIFDIPVEFHIALINQESKFDPNAVSYASALGIAQFMRETAKGMGLRVYSKELFPEIEKAENRLAVVAKETNKLWDLVMVNLKSNNFDKMISLKLEYDKSRSERATLTENVAKMYKNNLEQMDDERIREPHRALDLSSRHISELGRHNETKYGGREAHSVLRAIMAYNCGQGNVNKGEGFPFIQQTVQYVRRIMLEADKLAPKMKEGQVYEVNPAIFHEMLISQKYDMK